MCRKVDNCGPVLSFESDSLTGYRQSFWRDRLGDSAGNILKDEENSTDNVDLRGSLIGHNGIRPA
jgi:hypothetical protein